MNKNNYLSLALITVFLGFSLYVMLVEPHNFMEITDLSEEEIEKEITIKPEDPNEVERYLSNWPVSILSDANNYKKYGKIDEQQYQQINELLQKGLSEYRDYTYDKSNQTLYFSLWYVTRARAHTNHYRVQNCISESINIVNKYKPLFFFLKSEDREIAKELKKKANRFNNYMEYSNRHPDNINKVISEVKTFWNIRNDYKETERTCDKFNTFIDKDYEYQKSFLKIKLLILLAAAIIIFWLGKIITWDRIKKLSASIVSIGKVPHESKKQLFPKSVKPETIKQIIKLGSLVTTIASIIALFVTILGINNWLFISVPIICIICLLASVTLGVVSINTNDERFRRASYYLFLVGMFLFVFFILEIILVINLASLFNSIKQVASTVLTNSTII
jgi:hypothetical protein